MGQYTILVFRRYIKLDKNVKYDDEKKQNTGMNNS